MGLDYLRMLSNTAPGSIPACFHQRSRMFPAWRPDHAGPAGAFQRFRRRPSMRKSPTSASARPDREERPFEATLQPPLSPLSELLEPLELAPFVAFLFSGAATAPGSIPRPLPAVVSEAYTAPP